jgi:regulator of sirC expression with transglutaminase-like and TPR domain
VLQTRKGLPITLSLIYKVIAERIGLSVVGVNAPLHFMAGVQLDDKVLLIDPFFNGRAVSREEAFERIEQVAGRAVPRVDEMLPVASHRQWIARILGNLLNLFQHTEQMCDYRAMLELRGVLMTEA